MAILKNLIVNGDSVLLGDLNIHGNVTANNLIYQGKNTLNSNLVLNSQTTTLSNIQFKKDKAELVGKSLHQNTSSGEYDYGVLYTFSADSIQMEHVTVNADGSQTNGTNTKFKQGSQNFEFNSTKFISTVSSDFNISGGNFNATVSNNIKFNSGGFESKVGNSGFYIKSGDNNIFKFTNSDGIKINTRLDVTEDSGRNNQLILNSDKFESVINNSEGKTHWIKITAGGDPFTTGVENYSDINSGAKTALIKISDKQDGFRTYIYNVGGYDGLSIGTASSLQELLSGAPFLPQSGGTISGTLSIDYNLSVTGETNLVGTVSIDDNLVVNSSAQFNSDVTFDEDISINGNIITSSTVSNIGSSNNRFNEIYANDINANTKITANGEWLEISQYDGGTINKGTQIINKQGPLYIGTKYSSTTFSPPTETKCEIILSNGNASFQNILITGNLVPTDNESYTLGANSLRWSEIYGKYISASDKMEATNGFFQTSDIRKKNIKKELDLSKAYELINKCQTIVYTLKDDETKKEQIGLIAQEVKEIFPEIVNEDINGILSIDYAKLSVILMQIAKEQQKQIASIENRLAKLEQKFN